MIDRTSRDVAAKLVRDWRDGFITNDDLQDRWPAASTDRALAALESMLWRTYDDHRVHKLDNPPRDLVEELTRCAAFLDTELTYEWSEDRFDTIDWLAALNRMTFGLLPVVSDQLKRRDARIALEGNVLVWPFSREEDLPDFR